MLHVKEPQITGLLFSIQNYVEVIHTCMYSSGLHFLNIVIVKFRYKMHWLVEKGCFMRVNKAKPSANSLLWNHLEILEFNGFLSQSK